MASTGATPFPNCLPGALYAMDRFPNRAVGTNVGNEGGLIPAVTTYRQAEAISADDSLPTLALKMEDEAFGYSKQSGQSETFLRTTGFRSISLSEKRLTKWE